MRYQSSFNFSCFLQNTIKHSDYPLRCLNDYRNAIRLFYCRQPHEDIFRCLKNFIKVCHLHYVPLSSTDDAGTNGGGSADIEFTAPDAPADSLCNGPAYCLPPTPPPPPLPADIIPHVTAARWLTRPENCPDRSARYHWLTWPDPNEPTRLGQRARD